MITPAMITEAQSRSKAMPCIHEGLCEICYRIALQAVIRESIDKASPSEKSELWQDYGRVCDEMMDSADPMQPPKTHFARFARPRTEPEPDANSGNTNRACDAELIPVESFVGHTEAGGIA